MRLALLPLISLAMTLANARELMPVTGDSIVVSNCLGGETRIPLDGPSKHDGHDCAAPCHALCNRKDGAAGECED